MTATEQKWTGRVQGWRDSGLTVREFSKERGFSPSALWHWARQFKQREIATRTAATNPACRVRMVRVERIAAVTAPATLTVEIGAARLSVPSGADQAMLRATIGALLAAVKVGRR